MATDRWHNEAALMEAGSPETWHDFEAAAVLLQTNQTTLAACRAAAAKTKKDQHHTISVPVP